jgi:hypothetical protein
LPHVPEHGSRVGGLPARQRFTARRPDRELANVMMWCRESRTSSEVVFRSISPRVEEGGGHILGSGVLPSGNGEHGSPPLCSSEKTRHQGRSQNRTVVISTAGRKR